MQALNPVHYPVTSTFYHISCDFILTWALSILKLPHSYHNLSFLSWVSSTEIASLNPIKATHVDCNLFLGIYIIKLLKILLPNPSHFNLPSANLPFPSLILLYFSIFSPFTLHTIFQNNFLFQFTS